MNEIASIPGRLLFSNIQAFPELLKRYGRGHGRRGACVMVHTLPDCFAGNLLPPVAFGLARVRPRSATRSAFRMQSQRRERDAELRTTKTLHRSLHAHDRVANPWDSVATLMMPGFPSLSVLAAAVLSTLTLGSASQEVSQRCNPN